MPDAPIAPAPGASGARRRAACCSLISSCARDALSPAIAEARLQALQARIRPHFLFNSINAVLSLVRSEPQRAEDALQDMADLFRVLMRDNRDLAPLADEVELCRQYLELEQLRLGERLHVDWNVKSMPGDALVPPLVLQPLLENAVYHGIEPSSEPGKVSINIFLHARRSARDPAQSRTARTAAAITPATRWRSATSASASRCISTPRRASSRACTKDGYEVHIRMPYRTVRRRGSVARDAAASRRPTPSRQRAARNGRAREPARNAGGCPWLTRRCAC